MFSSSAIGSITGLSFLSPINDGASSSSSSLLLPIFSSFNPSAVSSSSSVTFFKKPIPFHRLSTSCTVKISVSDDIETKASIADEGNEEVQEPEPEPEPEQEVNSAHEALKAAAEVRKRQARMSADWKAVKAYQESGSLCSCTVEGSNNGGLLIRFLSLRGFLPRAHLSPSRSKPESQTSMQEIGKSLLGKRMSLKVLQADVELKKLIFSERLAIWSDHAGQMKVGDVFEGKVAFVEDYGAFINLRFPDGVYHVTGLVHVSEISWDVVQNVRDILKEGDKVHVKIISIDWQKCRVTLSIKQLEADPLLETLDQVIPQDGQFGSDSFSSSNSYNIEPLPGLDTICKELLQEDGITEATISRQGFEKRVVSPDLQLWLSNAPAINNQSILLARAGRQVQEVHLTTTLDQEGIKKALQRVLERIP